MPVVACAPAIGSSIPRSRFVRSRAIEKPPRFGEKPYAQLVEEAFEGPVLRLSPRLRLLEEANNRNIRRGDALDLIAATQRRLEKEHAICPSSPATRFVRHFITFAFVYITVAIAWCVLVALT